MITWFTSDTHFGHKRICELEKRPFGTPVLETDTDDERYQKAITNCALMDEAIIENWNKHVSKKDRVYHLGDFAFHDEERYLSRLNGQIHIVFGNHDDKSTRKIKERFASNHDLFYMKVNGQKIHLCHYKLEVWRSNYRGTWHLFGHSHGQLKPWIDCVCPNCQHEFRLSRASRSLDVGIMQKGWKPGIPWLWSFEEVAEYMKDKPLSKHHDDMEMEEA